MAAETMRRWVLPACARAFGMSLYAFGWDDTNAPGRLALSDVMQKTLAAFIRTGDSQQQQPRSDVGPLDTHRSAQTAVRRDPDALERDAVLRVLVQLRRNAGINQSLLPSRLGITQSEVSKFERGERHLDAARLRAWLQVLAMPSPVPSSSPPVWCSGAYSPRHTDEDVLRQSQPTGANDGLPPY